MAIQGIYTGNRSVTDKSDNKLSGSHLHSSPNNLVLVTVLFIVFLVVLQSQCVSLMVKGPVQGLVPIGDLLLGLGDAHKDRHALWKCDRYGIKHITPSVERLKEHVQKYDCFLLGLERGDTSTAWDGVTAGRLDIPKSQSSENGTDGELSAGAYVQEKGTRIAAGMLEF